MKQSIDLKSEYENYKETIVNTEIRIILFDKCFYYSGCKFGFPLLPGW